MVHCLGLRANVPRLQCTYLAVVTVTCHNSCFIPIDDMHLLLLTGLMKTQDWAETSVLFDNDIYPTISASGVSLLIIMPVPSHTEFFQCMNCVHDAYE